MYKIILMCGFTLLAACTTTAPQTAMVNDTVLNFSVNGDGPPLYLLHGGMESRDSFKYQIPVLAKHFTIVAIDSREQGRSGPSDAQISYDLMSKDVVALARNLGHDRISIMGSSDGGVTALTTAFHHPELIDKLIVLGANYHVSSYSEEMRSFIEIYQWDGDTNPDTYPGIFIKHYLTGHDDLSGFGELLQEMSRMWLSSPNFTTEDISTIKAKTLVINGDHDDMDLNHTLSLYKALPDAQLFIVPDGDHYALSKKPDLINKVVLDFLLGEII